VSRARHVGRGGVSTPVAGPASSSLIETAFARSFAWHHQFVDGSARVTEKTMSHRELLARERSLILEFLAARGARDVRVFGSVARGEDLTRSDIDLLIDLPDETSVGGELLTALGLSEELTRLLGVRVDVATARILRPEVCEQAVAEAIQL
jgi:predicted nucleotidyltransferase